MTAAKRESPGASAGICALLAALCLAVYLPGLSNGFVWDDELYISRNPAVVAGLSAASLRWAFTTFYAGNWHPLTWVSHLADVQLFGLEPLGHHGTNLFFHGANAILTFLVFRRLTGIRWSSACVAALFAVHPLHVESVAWVAERKDLLSTLFLLLALYAWIGRLRRPGVRRVAVAVPLYALALLAKPMPVTFPFLLLLLDWWPLGRLVPGRLTARVIEKLPFFALAALSCAVTLAAQSSVDAVGSVPVGVRLANIAVSYCRYLAMTFRPAGLALLYPFPAEAPAPAVIAMAAVALGTVTAIVLAVRRPAPALAAGWFWFLGTLVPVIGFVQVGTQALADRYTYLPLTGIFVMTVWGIGDRLGRDRGARLALLAATAAVVALLATAARKQVLLWRDPVVAFSNAIRVTRDNVIAHANLGAHYFERGDDPLAEREFRSAIAIADDFAVAHAGLAQLFERQGRIDAAIAEYRAALRGNPRLAEAYNNLGALLAVSGQWREAEFSIRQSLLLRSEFPSAQSNLGKLLGSQGRIAEALPHLREAVRLSAGTAGYHGDLGAALAAAGRLDEAAASLREALRLEPGLESARENLARVLAGESPRR
jgi:tetratricopeptide (TPR) repeat protein